MVTCKGWCTTRFQPWSTFFLIHVDDLSVDLLATVRLIADGTSLISVVHDSNIPVNELNNDLRKISEWAYKWKISFNPYLNK